VGLLMAKRGNVKIRMKPRLPGYDSNREVIPDLVQSPYDKTAFDAVVRNIRESTLETMRAHGHIDEAQLEAGTWFRATYERSRMGSMAIDPSREPVDTSGIADPIPDRMIAANQRLASARAELGVKGFRVVELVCGQGWSIREAAGTTQSRQRIEETGMLLRVSLDALAEWLGYATRSSR